MPLRVTNSKTEEPTKNANYIENSNMIFICVKPKDIFGILENFENVKNKTIVSCVASVNLKDINKDLPSKIVFNSHFSHIMVKYLNKNPVGILKRGAVYV